MQDTGYMIQDAGCVRLRRDKSGYVTLARDYAGTRDDRRLHR
jgi:hypothetical protein